MNRDDGRPAAALFFAGLGVLLLLVGSYWGLFVAPAETYMGDVQRIMYVHVPTAWNALLAFTFAFGCAPAFLLHGGWKWDSRMEAAMEVGVVLAGVEQFPEDFRESVLFEGAVVKAMTSQGDMRDAGFWQEFERQCRRMWADQKPGQAAARRLIQFGEQRGTTPLDPRYRYGG